MDGFSGDTRLVQDYLIAEVLSRQNALVREALFRTSIFDRFFAPLFEAVLGSLYVNALVAFQELVAGTGLLLIPLDTENEWYRYHHLFRDLLQRQLWARASREEISKLHRRASAWFAVHGFVEEALQHALAGHDTEAAPDSWPKTVMKR